MAICGMIEGYNSGAPTQLRYAMRIIAMRIMLKGFIYTDYLPRNGEFYAEMGPWVAGGMVKGRDTVVEGLENTVDPELGGSLLEVPTLIELGYKTILSGDHPGLAGCDVVPKQPPAHPILPLPIPQPRSHIVTQFQQKIDKSIKKERSFSIVDDEIPLQESGNEGKSRMKDPLRWKRSH